MIPLAYLDPGSGSLFLQLIVAGVAGVFVFVKYQGRRIQQTFARIFRGKRKDADAPDS